MLKKILNALVFCLYSIADVNLYLKYHECKNNLWLVLFIILTLGIIGYLINTYRKK